LQLTNSTSGEVITKIPKEDISSRNGNNNAIHTIFSSEYRIRKKGKDNNGDIILNSILQRRNKKKPRLDHDKYLIGRSYQLFKSAVRSEKTLSIYKNELWHFCDFVKMNTEEIVSKYGSGNCCNGDVNVNECRRANDNNEPPLKLQQKIEDYVLRIHTRIKNNELKTATTQAMVSPIKLFCEMNDIILNWKKISRLLPRVEKNAKDEAYTREQIKNMLEYSDLRTKIPILFMASSGMRLGGFIGLTDGCITPLYDEKGNNKLLTAHVVVYKGTPDQYDTFISPEAWTIYEQYRKLRIKFGEEITENSPILLRRFNISIDGKTATIDNTKQVGLSTVAAIISIAAYKAGIRQAAQNYNNNRYNIKVAHGFRKYFSTVVANVRTEDQRPAIDFIKKEWLLGHALTSIHSLEENYNRSDRVKILLEEYLKAVPDLTISNSERLLVENRKLQSDISTMRTVEVQLATKDKQIEALIRKQEQFEEVIQSLIDSGHLTPNINRQ
jgi:integrase